MKLSNHRYSHYQIMVWGISISGTKPLVPLETQKNLMAQWRDPEEVWPSFRGPRAQYGVAARLAWEAANSRQYNNGSKVLQAPLRDTTSEGKLGADKDDNTNEKETDGTAEMLGQCRVNSEGDYSGI